MKTIFPNVLIPMTRNVAWDIETCPRPYEELSDAHRERHRKESKHEMEVGAEEPSEEIKSKAASLHPMLGWICCISVAAGDLNEGYREPHSWVADSPDEEADMLRAFWDDIQKLSTSVQWITCNGKRFDVPFLSARSAKYRIAPTNSRILDTHKYRIDKHLDLANVWDAPWYSLADLCDHLGVESPKAEFDGSDVAPAIENGNSEKVRRYCERDAVATFRCAQAVQAVI
jgi:DNA polymerase elongation subunit (family B)